MPWHAPDKDVYDKGARLLLRKLRAIFLWGTSVLLSAIHVMIHAISVTLVHMRAFVVVETLSKCPNKAHGLKSRHWSLAQRSIPINTTLSVVTALYTRVYMESACSNGPESLFVRKDFNVAAPLLPDLRWQRCAGFCREIHGQA